MDSKAVKDIEDKIKKLDGLTNAIGGPLVNTDVMEETQVQIKVNNLIKHGSFLQVGTHTWETSEQTFRAMKKNIFTLEDSVDELVEPHQCHSCSSHLDLQFWNFCPYCGSEFKR